MAEKKSRVRINLTGAPKPATEKAPAQPAASRVRINLTGKHGK